MSDEKGPPGTGYAKAATLVCFSTALAVVSWWLNLTKRFPRLDEALTVGLLVAAVMLAIGGVAFGLLWHRLTLPRPPELPQPTAKVLPEPRKLTVGESKIRFEFLEMYLRRLFRMIRCRRAYEHETVMYAAGSGPNEALLAEAEEHLEFLEHNLQRVNEYLRDAGARDLGDWAPSSLNDEFARLTIRVGSGVYKSRLPSKVVAALLRSIEEHGPFI